MRVFSLNPVLFSKCCLAYTTPYLEFFHSFGHLYTSSKLEWAWIIQTCTGSTTFGKTSCLICTSHSIGVHDMAKPIYVAWLPYVRRSGYIWKFTLKLSFLIKLSLEEANHISKSYAGRYISVLLFLKDLNNGQGDRRHNIPSWKVLV